MTRKHYAIVLTTALALAGGYFVVLTPGEAQQQPAPPPLPELFTSVDVPDWQDPLLPEDTTILRSRPVTVNFDILAAARPPNPGAEPPVVPIRFNLFDDLSVTAVFHRATARYPANAPEGPSEPTGYTWHGRLVGDEHEGHVVMITDLGICLANVHIAGVGWFKIRSVEGAQYAVREIGGNAEGGCDGVVQGDSSGQGAGPEGTGGCGISFSYPCEQGTTIDVMVLYTPAARDQAGGQFVIVGEIAMAIAESNQAYVNSLISIQLDLVHVEEVQISGGFSLTQLIDPWDNILDEVHALRDSVRADLVCVLIGPGDGAGNRGWLMRTESPVFERNGFSTVNEGMIGPPNHTIAHEMGHNMGCVHNRGEYGSCYPENCLCHRGLCEDSFGYKFPPENPSYRTIMSYFDGEQKILHFSNPNVDYLGHPTGVALPACDSADNARTINESAETIANYRASCDTTNTTAMASSDFFVGQANGASREVSISDTGQYMAFTSDATIFPTHFGEAEPGVSDVYLYNRESSLVRLVSTHQTGAAGEANSYAPAISGDGHYIAFASDASDLYLNTQDSNNETDIYVSEQFLFGQATRVSVTTTEGQSVGGGSFAPSITFDGRFVAFASDATNLVGADGNTARDIFLRDRDFSGDGEFEDPPGDVSTDRVSLTTTGGEANGASFNPAISAEDGQFVAFESVADNLLAVFDTNEVQDIFVRDRDPLNARTFRVSVSTAGVAGDLASFAPSISAFGDRVVFESDATNLVSDDDNDVRDVFVHIVSTGITVRVSVAQIGEANGPSFAPSISADGDFVVFHSDATNLVAGDTNGLTDVFLYEIISGVLTRMSINSLGEQAIGGGSSAPAISADGRFVAFESDATNLGDEQIAGFRDILFRDRGPM